MAGKPLAMLCHGVVGLQHASMAMYNAWCDRVPVIVMGGNIMEADKRAPGAEWPHSAIDPGALTRDFTKWDDQPGSLQHFAESAVRAYKIAITRFDDRIRVGGMAEIVGYDKKLKKARRETLEMCVNDLFPGGGDTASATFWTGLRPMTPDGTPIVGRTPVPNLFLNTGHGTLGWTMSCGSGQLLADLMSGKQPAIRADDLSVHRYFGDVGVNRRPGYANA